MGISRTVRPSVSTRIALPENFIRSGRISREDVRRGAGLLDAQSVQDSKSHFRKYSGGAFLHADVDARLDPYFDRHDAVSRHLVTDQNANA